MNHPEARERIQETEASAQTLFGIIRAHAGTNACDWMKQVFATSSPLGGDSFAIAFTAAARRMGKHAIELGPRELAPLRWSGTRHLSSSWTLDELARALLLVHAAGVVAAEPFKNLVEECYARGDNRERRAVLRALVLLPQPERFVTLAVEACRSSIQPIFEAVACENPYPAAYFPELNFNQMVLKALFTDAALGRIMDLPSRVTPELCHMATDYASERRAAGRSVPPDIEWLLNQMPA